MKLETGQIACERCSAEGSPRELWCARVHLSEGPEGLRLAYGSSEEIARVKLEIVTCSECQGTGVIVYGPGRELDCEQCDKLKAKLKELLNG